MATFDETLKVFEAGMDKQGLSYDSALFTAVTKSLGPSIYSNDASRVSCSQASEMETVKNNFLIKKLGLSESDGLDEAMAEVCEKLGKSNRDKYRACFYYLLVKKYSKEAMFS